MSSLPPKKNPIRNTKRAKSFASRWRGKFKPAERVDPRYDALAKKYLE